MSKQFRLVSTAPAVTSSVELITPDIARALLENNPSQRTVSQVTVDAYARDMERGQWHTTGEGLSINVDGQLVNGQHRCHAIIKSGKSLRLVVVRNVQREATHDRGRIRTLADILRMKGYPDAPRVAAAIGYIHRLSQESKSVSKMTEADMDSYMMSYASALDWFFRVEKSRAFSGSYFVGALMWVYPLHPDKVDEFYRHMISGANLEAGHPALSLRDSMARQDTAGQQNSFNASMRTLNAFKAFLDGKQHTRTSTGTGAWEHFRGGR